MKTVKIGFVLLILATKVAFHQHAEAQDPAQRTVLGDGGGVMVGNGQRIIGTFGQPVVGVMGNSTHRHAVGFWPLLRSSILSPLELIHQPLSSTRRNQPLTFSVEIPGVTNTEVTLYYKIFKLNEAPTAFQTIPMKRADGQRWEVTLPASNTATGMVYHIRASDSQKGEGSFPAPLRGTAVGVRFQGALETKGVRRVFQMVSIPTQPNQTAVRDVFSESGTVSEDWTLRAWNGSNTVEVSTMEPGRGYWMSIKDEDNTSIQVGGTTFDPTKSYTIDLKTGWNQIGNPFAFPIFWANTRVKANDSDESYPIFDPAAGELLRSTLYQWDDNTLNNTPDGRYNILQDPATKLLPWKGYWIKALSDVQLIYSPSTETPPAAPPSPQPFLWQIELSAYTDSAADRGNILGVAPNARIGRDRYDAEKPPPPTGNLALTFPHADWGIDADDYTVDLRAPFEGEAVWDVQLRTANTTPAILRWTDAGEIPSTYYIYLEDWTNGQRIDMRRHQSFAFIPNGTTSSFKIRVTQQAQHMDIEGFIPQTFALLPNYPNPFNPETWIPYQLAQPSRVTIHIYDATGRLTQSIDVGNQAAGTYTGRERAAYWDGRNLFGETVASGIYFYRLVAGDYRAVRKMLLMK